MPQLTAVMDCAEIGKQYDIPIISDGGTRTSGDATKALAAGASSVMLGSMLGGTDESPGSTITKNGKRYKFYSGMASLGAARRRKSKEVTQTDNEDDLNGDHIFRLMSMSKPITALAAMQLVETGKLNLDSPAEEILPELANIPVLTDDNRLVKQTKSITLRHLMSHTSGFAYNSL